MIDDNRKLVSVGIFLESAQPHFDPLKVSHELVPVLSWPHFLHAEAKYQDAVEGLKPDKNIHGFWFDIQQVTGTTLSAKVRYLSICCSFF